VEEQRENLEYGAVVVTKKNGKLSEKVVYGPPVCKECGTKVFLMTNNKYICVLCHDEKSAKDE